MNTAFEFLRQHKEVRQEVESLVLRKMYYTATEGEMLAAFENGISGKYGKIYTLDAQTLIKWINNFKNEGKEGDLWINSTMIGADIGQHHKDYPLTNKQWNQQVNRAYMAHKSGLNERLFHPDLYSYLVLDDKIKLGSLKKYTPPEYPECSDEEIKAAMRKVVKDFFIECDKRGMQFIYSKSQCDETKQPAKND